MRSGKSSVSQQYRATVRSYSREILNNLNKNKEINSYLEFWIGVSLAMVILSFKLAYDKPYVIVNALKHESIE